MVGWQEAIAQIADQIDDHFDRLKYRLWERLGEAGSLMIQPYRGFGTPEKLYLKGRVLVNKRVTPAGDNDTIWENLANMYRRFESDEIPAARVLARFQGNEQEIIADEEGFFEVWLEPSQPAGEGWHSVELELLEPRPEGNQDVKATGEAFVPPRRARFGVISDLDDTVVMTDANNLLRMARTVFLGNARTRLPFEGVAEFYRALSGGQRGDEMNPLFYVSSSPWNLYDLFADFLELRGLPPKPVLFLRDWGISSEEILPVGNRAHKHKVISKLLDLYEHLSFILVGDSGQEDPEIYSELVSQYPSRILAIYIRNVTPDADRLAEIRRLARETDAIGSPLILASNTLPMAEHAFNQGWIAPDTLPLIRLALEAGAGLPDLLD